MRPEAGGAAAKGGRGTGHPPAVPAEGGAGARGAGPGRAGRRGTGTRGWAAAGAVGLAGLVLALAAVHRLAGWVEVWVLALPVAALVQRRCGGRWGVAAAAVVLAAMAVGLALDPGGGAGWRLWLAEAAAMVGTAALARGSRAPGPTVPPAARESGEGSGGPAPGQGQGRAVAVAAGQGQGRMVAVAPGRGGPAGAGPGGGAATAGAAGAAVAGPTPPVASGGPDREPLPERDPLDESELQVLYACTHALNKVTSLDDLIREFNDLLSARLGYPYLALLLVQPDGSLRLASAPLYPPEVQGLVLRKGQGICSAVVETGQPVIVDDVTRDPRYYPGLAGARSQIAVPVTRHGRVVGVLSVESPQPAAFSRRDLRLLGAIADEVAVALERASLLERIEQQAITDPLTGLYNRTYLMARLREEGERAARYGRPLALLFIDLDDLKAINDRLGHEAGDRVLVRVARVLREACRSVDYAARYGGDEFVVVLPETGPEGAMAVATRIQQRLADEPNPLAAGTGGRGLGASIGVAAYPADARDWTELLRLADEAMYGAKRRGKRRVARSGGRGKPGASAPVAEEGGP